MAYTSTSHTASGVSVNGILRAIGSGFSRFGHALIANSAGAKRLARVEALQAKSDEELTAMGIRRDRIVHTVFRDIL